MNNNDYKNEIFRMVEEQIINRGINDIELIHAFRIVPRHLFVPDNYQHLAYSDGPLPIGFGQTISQPYIVALMISQLDLTGNEQVLEIGTGCGYQSAILSHMVANVITMEIVPELAGRATKTMDQLGIKNVSVKTGDGSAGWKCATPYDAILISAAAPQVPTPLLEQLADGGRLILPVGKQGYQRLELWTYTNSEYKKATGIPVAFVPLLGMHGWK
jgi:protein-L-isoaspartate(D-aspartate) O-methyltransferase